MIWFASGAAAMVVLAAFIYLGAYLRWVRNATAGMAYFGLAADERRALKRRIARRAWPVLPLVHLLAWLTRRRAAMPAFRFEGVAGPPGVSSAAAFARAKAYRPRPEDVFVVAQMRCGTTWMQQLVHQIVTRGRGGFDAPERSHLYTLSPWIEVLDGVPIDAAPTVGAPPTRIVKTHLPASLCPYAAAAKYIYVARHPVACFASIVDFNHSLVGPLLPPPAALLDWFCSDEAYWSPWPRHVDGWWRLARQRPNVLFVHFEAMKRDFASVRDQVAAFLGCDLTDDERARVDERCSFAYMKAQADAFEMAAPTMFSAASGDFMPSGKLERAVGVAPEIRARIARYCAEALDGAGYPIERFYPDLGPVDRRGGPDHADAR